MKAASLDSESHADYAELPKQLLRTLVDTARAARLGLSEDVLEELSMLPFDSENHEGGTGRRDLTDKNVGNSHRRLARLFSSEDRSWDSVYKSLDAYVQRLGTSGENTAPCEEYTLLQKEGQKMLLAFKRKSASRV